MATVCRAMVHIDTNKLVLVAIVGVGLSHLHQLLKLFLVASLCAESSDLLLHQFLLLSSFQEALTSHNTMVRVWFEVENVRELAV